MRASGTRNAASAILVLLALGFALRLIIAYILPGSGFGVDLNAFRFWADNLATNGPWGFYERDFFHDYTPGYLYLLWFVGSLQHLLPGLELIKVPAMLADLAVGWLIWSMVLELGGGSRAALIGAALYLFVPVTWFDSVVWGQVDSVGLVFLLLGLRELWRDRPERATAYAVVAAIVKPQLGILIPILLAVLLRRYLIDALERRSPGIGGQAVGGVVAAAGFVAAAIAVGYVAPILSIAWLVIVGLIVAAALGLWWWLKSPREGAADLMHGPFRLATAAATGSLLGLALTTPFKLTLNGLIGQVQATAGGYPYLTINAYNPWALITSGGAGLAQSGQWLCDAVTGTAADTPCPPGTETLIGPFPAVAVGALLFVVAALVIVLVVLWRPDPLTILTGLTVIAIAFFVVPTRVHERYLFPFFALGAIAAAVSIRWRIAYIVLGVTTFLNMYVVLTTLYPDNPQISDWLGIGTAIRGWQWVAAIATVNLLAFLWSMLQLRPGAVRSLAGELAGSSGAPPASSEARPVEGGLVVLSSSARVGSGGAVGGSAPSASAVDDRADPADAAPSARPGFYERYPELAFLSVVTDRLGGPSLRADRSKALRNELGGRLDRIDVWILVVLVISTFALRMWRLDEPASMHFDEVYHARTATEFLQDWRYGIPHSIYEFTHPHLAKYAMAAGIVMFGDDQVTTSSSLGTTVTDAAIEPRWDDPSMPDHRAGDRLYVATGSEVRAYDLQSRALLATIAVPGASAVAVDTAGHRLLISTAAGAVSEMDTQTTFDPLRTGADAAQIDPPVALGTFGTPIRHIFATDDGMFLLATTASGDVASMDAGNGQDLGLAGLSGAADIETAGTADGLVADPASVADPSAAASTLAGILGTDAASIEKRLTAGTDRVVIAGSLDDTVHSRVEAAIADGRLAGFTFIPLSRVAVADSKGISMVSPANASVTDEVPIAGGATGLVASTGLDSAKLYVAGGRTVTVVDLPDSTDPTAPPKVELAIQMPGDVSKVTFDTASIMVHVLGKTPDGSADTVYVIEPHGNAVFADARLPFTPVAWATDAAPLYPSADREALLTFDASGSVASVDIGNHEFSWRVPGVFLGALTAGLLFLLARLLFRRRSIGVLVAVFALVDGMLFVQSRIGMNDVYVGFFLMAAYVLFAGLWLGRWRWRGAFWVLMPLIGVMLGLGLASKWVAAYAIAAVGLLILVRSALGRVLTILAMIGATIFLGFQGLQTPVPDSGQALSSGPNYFFMFLMIGLTLIAVAVTVLHPIAWSSEEMWFAVAAPAVAGTVLGLGAIVLASRTASTVKLGPVSGAPWTLALSAAIGLFLVAAFIALVFGLVARFGIGPLAGTPAPTDTAAMLEPPAPPPPGWLRPGTTFGLPVIWMLGSLLVLPVVVYIITYIPWALNSGGQAGSPVIFPAGTPIIGQWPPGHDGQTLVALTTAMYNYHNDLRAAHAAASPWWAWPLDLKPVWFYQGSFAGNTSAAIYNAGNLVIWWLSIPALGFICWQAFKRRSLALALIAIAFAFQWLSWSRIDRATFQYHYYTSVPFIILALAYFLAELWHGPSSRTWWLARISAAVAVMGPGLMWVFKEPICSFVGVDRAYPNSPACVGSPATIVVTARTAGLILVIGLAIIAIVYEVGRMGASRERDETESRRSIVRLIAAAGAAVLGIVVVGAIAGDQVLLDLKGFSTTPLAIGMLVVLAFVAWFVIRARDPRRFVVGAVIAAVVEFVVFYPNIAALPLPTTIFNAYQGLLPTYLYAFQFPVNTDPPAIVPSLFAPNASYFGLPPGPLLALFLGLACVIVAYSAWTWRVVLAEQALRDASDDDGWVRSG